jgi:hypothetical protein
MTDVGQLDLVRPGGHEGLSEQIVGNRQGVPAVGGEHAKPAVRRRTEGVARISPSLRPRLTERPSARKVAWMRGAP